MMNFELITTYYHTDEKERAAENIECLANNASNPLITKIHLFLQGEEKPDIPDQNKLVYIEHSRRPTFADFFAYANCLPDDSIKIVANSDIFFNNTLSKVVEALQKVDILALTRWDRLNDGSITFYNNPKSQDTWIFKGQLPMGIGNYFIGQHGCDIRLLYELKQKNIRFANYSWDIKTIHLHQSGLRSYFNNPNYVYVKPPFEFALPDYIAAGLETKLKNKKFVQSRYRFLKSILKNTNYGKMYSPTDRLKAVIPFIFWNLMLKLHNNLSTP